MTQFQFTRIIHGLSQVIEVHPTTWSDNAYRRSGLGKYTIRPACTYPKSKRYKHSSFTSYLISNPPAPLNSTMSQPQILRIAMLNADVCVPTIAPIYPTYGRIFHELLTKAIDPKKQNITIESIDFDVQKSQYPSSLSNYDAIIISGSASSAYDDEPWIHALTEYIRHVYTTYPHVKIYGSCFGHQIVCSALLDGYGVRVEQDPSGWEIGVKSISFDPKFLATFPFRDGVTGQGMKLQFIHHDHVVLPPPSTPALPADWITVGQTTHCAVQGIYQPNRVFTLQGHFEFDRRVNAEVIKYFFGKDWEVEEVDRVLRDIDADDDARMAAGMVLGFLLGEGNENGREDVEKGCVGMSEEIDWERQRVEGVVSA